jgi:hypothetical protein
LSVGRFDRHSHVTCSQANSRQRAAGRPESRRGKRNQEPREGLTQQLPFPRLPVATWTVVFAFRARRQRDDTTITALRLAIDGHAPPCRRFKLLLGAGRTIQAETLSRSRSFLRVEGFLFAQTLRDDDDEGGVGDDDLHDVGCYSRGVRRTSRTCCCRVERQGPRPEREQRARRPPPFPNHGARMEKFNEGRYRRQQQQE